MKILYVCPKIGNNNFGGEKLCIDLANHFHDEWLEIWIAAQFENWYNQHINVWIKTYNLSRYNHKRWRKLFYDYFHPVNYLSFKKAIQEFKPDIVHFHNVYWIWSYLVKLASSYSKVIATAHDYFLLDYQWFKIKTDGQIARIPILSWLHKKIIYYFYKTVTIIAPSHFLHEKLIQRWFSNVVQIYNWINLNNDIKSITSERAHNILWVWNIYDIKWLHIVLPTVDKFTQANPHFKFLIVWDWVMRAELQTKFPLPSREGFQNPDPYYEKCWILIFSSICFENQPYVVCEAMAKGLCVIRNNIWSAKEMFEDWKSGLLYNSQEDLLQILDKIAVWEIDIKDISKNAIKFAQTNYNIEHMFTDYLVLYQNIFQ